MFYIFQGTTEMVINNPHQLQQTPQINKLLTPNLGMIFQVLAQAMTNLENQQDIEPTKSQWKCNCYKSLRLHLEESSKVSLFKGG